MGRALLILAVFLSARLCLARPVVGQPGSSPAKVYIEEGVKTTTGASAYCDTNNNCYGQTGRTRAVTRELVKICQTLRVTDKREAADYVLRISAGSSTLYQKSGDLIYTSDGGWTVPYLAKHVCDYIGSEARK